MKTQRLIILLAIISPLLLKAEGTNTTSGKTVYLKTQFAGNMGVLSVGIGKTFFNCVGIDINYGYIPQWINGSEIHSIALKTAVRFCKMPVLSNQKLEFYLGISTIYGITHNTHLSYPSYFPSKYYEPNAIHFNPMIGGILLLPVSHKSIEAIAVFSEIGSADYQIWYALQNKKIGLKDILNLSFGLGITLR